MTLVPYEVNDAFLIRLLVDEGIAEIEVPLVKNEEPFYILEKFYRACEREYSLIKFYIRLN